MEQLQGDRVLPEALRNEWFVLVKESESDNPLAVLRSCLGENLDKEACTPYLGSVMPPSQPMLL